MLRFRATQSALFRRESIAMASMGADEPPTPPVRPRVLPLSSADHQLIKKIHTYKGGEEPPVKSPRRSDRIAARRSGAPLVREPSISTPVCRVGASARPYITRDPPTIHNDTTKLYNEKSPSQDPDAAEETPSQDYITHNQYSYLTHQFTLHRVRRRRRHRKRHRKRYEINCK